jgi:hypothetical protein
MTMFPCRWLTEAIGYVNGEGKLFTGKVIHHHPAR